MDLLTQLKEIDPDIVWLKEKNGKKITHIIMII